MPARTAHAPGGTPTVHPTTRPGARIRRRRRAASRPFAALQRTTVFRRVAALRAHARTRLADDRGAATAEYAVATMAAVGFAGLLVVLLRGDEVRGILTDLVRNALTVG